jgi:hypothetical protein
VPWWDLQPCCSINQFLSAFASKNADFRYKSSILRKIHTQMCPMLTLRCSGKSQHLHIAGGYLKIFEPPGYLAGSDLLHCSLPGERMNRWRESMLANVGHGLSNFMRSNHKLDWPPRPLTRFPKTMRRSSEPALLPICWSLLICLHSLYVRN